MIIALINPKKGTLKKYDSTLENINYHKKVLDTIEKILPIRTDLEEVEFRAEGEFLHYRTEKAYYKHSIV